MKKNKLYTSLLLLFIISNVFISCSSPSSSSDDSSLEPTSSFTPSENAELASLAENTFEDNNVKISIDPEYINFSSSGNLKIDDNEEVSFTLENNSGETKSFKFQILSISSGFSILDENDTNIGNWSGIEIESGSSKTFTAKFTAYAFGTHSSYLTITANDTNGYIKMPLQATVSGSSNLTVISTNYLCGSSSAEEIDYIDFSKVSYGLTSEYGIKICNGGTDLEIYSASITDDDAGIISDSVTDTVYEDTIWNISDSIDDEFSLGLIPTFTQVYSEPSYMEYNGEISNPDDYYSVELYDSGKTVNNVTIDSGSYLKLNVKYSPELDIEASEGYLYEAIPVNATLLLDTSLGEIEIPLVASTSGKEPVLKLSYKLQSSEEWNEIDLTSDGSALNFGDIQLFKDWITDNYTIVDIKVENVGSGSKNLEFYPNDLSGYFEYYTEDGEDPEFPLLVNSSNSSKTFQIRYLPTPDDRPSSSTWDFGQLTFNHTGGNQAHNRIAFIGQQESGYAVEFKLGGASLKREYDDGEQKNFCTVLNSSSNSGTTQKTFRVYNNNKSYDLDVSYNISVTNGSFSTSPSSGSFTVAPNSFEDFTVEFTTSEDEGQTIAGIIQLDTNYPSSVESKYSSELSDLESRSFTVPFQATSSSSDSNSLCSGEVLGKYNEETGTDTRNVTFIFDRVTMILTDLTEATRNPPAFKFHFPLELDQENGHVRIKEDIPFIYDLNDERFSPIKQIRSYTHQATNIQGCAPLTTNPYKLEFQKGSWTGPGMECKANGTGTVTLTDQDGSTRTVNTDSACMDNNGAENTTVDGVNWTVFYHDFVKFDTDACEVQFYGRFSTFAFKPDQEEIWNVFERAEENPNEDESFYEDVYGAYRFDSYITFVKATTCAGKSYSAGDTETDPDAIKACYSDLATKTSSTRLNGFLNECSYFNFSIDQGIVPEDAYDENPDYDSWEGFGIYEPYEEDGKVFDTKYDITIYNAHMKAFVINAGDRFSFFGHPGKLIYSDIFATITTKRVAEEEWEDGDWKQRIAVESRSHFDKNQVFLKDRERYETAKYWTADGVNSEFSNVIDAEDYDPGEITNGNGKGAFRYHSSDPSVIIPAGLPINYDENNLLFTVALGTFQGQGNTAPGFTKADSSTGKGKALYFGFHGCIFNGEPDENQGCYNYKLDDYIMPGTSNYIRDEYVEAGMLPNEYPDASDCAKLADPGFNQSDSDDYDPYLYMSCVNYKIFEEDRKRYTNYYDSNKVTIDEDYYGSSTCGYGM